MSLICAQSADGAGNLYTGPNTEDTPVIAEATAFKRGIVIAQVNEVKETLPRVDIAGDWVDYVVKSPAPLYRALVHSRPGANLGNPGSHGHDGHQGDLCRI